MKETITMFDQMQFKLACGHVLVLGRLDGRDTWTCEECGKPTDLRVEPYRTQLARDRDIADQIDKQALQRGERLVRADHNDPPRPGWFWERRAGFKFGCCQESASEMRAAHGQRLPGPQTRLGEPIIRRVE